MARSLRIVVYATSGLIAGGIRAFLGSYQDLQLVHFTSDYTTLIPLCLELCPDVVLFLTSSTSNAHCPFLQEYHQQSRTPILLLALDYDKSHFCQLLDAGIHGYLLVGVDDELLATAIHTVGVGGRWFSSVIDNQAFRLAMTNHNMVTSHSDMSEITEREKYIMQLIAQGWSNQQIGQVLGVTERTVRFHIRNIYDKLHLTTRTEVIIWMMKAGLRVA